MPVQYLDFQYLDGELSPFYYVLKLFKGEVDWDKHTFYFDLMVPIRSEVYSEIDDNLINYGVHISELIINKDYPNKLGINLSALKRRISFDIHDPSVIEQFLLYAPDVMGIIGEFPRVNRMEYMLTT
ncbi:hypothetical protein [Cytobacillus praedii]|uniref:Uncharacterized protein n=1 Tax=Cytobacillus praedii TaxID=1742358 RepID=A0A4R1ANC8_9BACI|nr:hypothetical protein [Cytobacillus praedii]TCJ01333.1 hypothetical protein E0Y62_24470 [Cytobacillus praedii]